MTSPTTSAVEALNTREILSNSLALLRCKYGNTDPSANVLMDQIEAALEQGEGEPEDDGEFERRMSSTGPIAPVPGAWTEEVAHVVRDFCFRQGRFGTVHSEDVDDLISTLTKRISTLNATPGATTNLQNLQSAPPVGHVEPSRGIAPAVEAILVRRILKDRMDGYTLEASREIADKIRALYKPHVGAVGAGWKLDEWERRKLFAHASDRAFTYAQHHADGLMMTADEIASMNKWKALSDKLSAPPGTAEGLQGEAGRDGDA